MVPGCCADYHCWRFCSAIAISSNARVSNSTLIDHAVVGILAQAMQSMALRGFIAHNRESGAYALTDSGRATLGMILDHAGIKIPPK
jgi:hypothetical protein